MIGILCEGRNINKLKEYHFIDFMGLIEYVGSFGNIYSNLYTGLLVSSL